MISGPLHPIRRTWVPSRVFGAPVTIKHAGLTGRTKINVGRLDEREKRRFSQRHFVENLLLYAVLPAMETGHSQLHLGSCVPLFSDHRYLEAAVQLVRILGIAALPCHDLLPDEADSRY